MSLDYTSTNSETPPLTRGRPPSTLYRTLPSGNTPAYAGKTRSSHEQQSLPEKHPRLRGEDALLAAASSASGETPPLTRGRPTAGCRCRDQRGNTPAYAGKTLTHNADIKLAWKHPRLRGEDMFQSRSRRLQAETPPLTRGRPSCCTCSPGALRNTPAYAGKTVPGSATGSDLWKHPRLRGEDHHRAMDATGDQETPPLTRGRLPCAI